MKVRLLPLLALALLAGCGPSAPTVIDGTSQESFEQSAAMARRDLPAGDRLDFDRALATVPTRRFGASDADQLRRTTFDKMTAAEVVEDYRQRQH